MQRNILIPVFGCLTGLMLLAVGCPMSDGDGGARPRDAGLEILDGGDARIDASVLIDGGQNTDAGPGMVDAGQPDGGGGFMLPDGGLLGPDGGVDLIEYESTPEDGVFCGTPPELCDVGAACCVSVNFMDFSLTSACGDTSGMCAPGGFQFSCDDTQNDCGAAAECCATVAIEAFPPQANSQCVPTDSCSEGGGLDVCTTSADCDDGFLCCGLDLGIDIPVDMGACQESCG